MSDETTIQLTTDKDDKHPLHKKQPSAIGKSDGEKGTLKATLPESIVFFLNLKAGDKLEWTMDILDGKRVAIVKKLKLTGEEPKKGKGDKASIAVEEAIEEYIHQKAREREYPNRRIGKK